MKRFLIFAAFLIFTQIQCFGHAWVVTRGWCGWFFHERYQAWAQTSALSYTTYSTGYDCWGRWLGKQPYAGWYTTCNHHDKGCTRPRRTTCSSSGYIADYIWDGCYLFFGGAHAFSAYAHAENNIGSIVIVQSASGRGSAGYTDTFIVDSTRFNALDTNGISQDSITGGGVEIDTNTNDLVINNLNGTVNITNRTDYYSKFQIVVFKENDMDTTDTTEVNIENGVFNNVVYSAQINVTKGNIQLDGFFDQLSPNQLSLINSDQTYGVNLNNVSLTLPMQAKLGPNEHLTALALVDGGFDISSAVIGTPKPGRVQRSNQLKSIGIYPNPANNTINCNIEAASDDETVSIKAFDISGRDLGEIYSGRLHQGANTISNIDVSRLPAGINLIQVNAGSSRTYQKITINR